MRAILPEIKITRRSYSVLLFTDWFVIAVIILLKVEAAGVKSVVPILFVLLHLAFLRSVSPAKIPALVGEILCSDTPIFSFPDEGILPDISKTSGYPSSKGIAAP
ncbi:MAG: hypothetical protein LBG58_00095 [Planctomycetaceae bacterium]|jgi:hypothetical protein|nr:hypothetical protein [Planctomycetaceae bacterium]